MGFKKQGGRGGRSTPSPSVHKMICITTTPYCKRGHVYFPGLPSRFTCLRLGLRACKPTFLLKVQGLSANFSFEAKGLPNLSLFFASFFPAFCFPCYFLSVFFSCACFLLILIGSRTRTPMIAVTVNASQTSRASTSSSDNNYEDRDSDPYGPCDCPHLANALFVITFYFFDRHRPYNLTFHFIFHFLVYNPSDFPFWAP